MLTPHQLRFAGELGRAAEFRTALRRFLRRTEDVCAAHELDPRAYDLLLLVEAAPRGRPEWTLEELCDGLALEPGPVETALTDAERAGNLEREDVVPGAVVRVRLTDVGRRRLLAAFGTLDPERNRLLAAFERADAQLRALGTSLEPHEAHGL